ncbi:AbiV family abortive infection protein [Flavobacterium sp. N2820]|uniref:AbiV family abortive infection protein n=1 Tax=Flavobacterium sp. N2820 TaxID=2986834 RepID=UPI002225A4BC|nr:AbiV family abortive infection protein [Flavobacterium sp. N2820]
MSQFLNISPKNSKSLHCQIYKNAQKLRRDAMLVAQNNKSYSTATSLIVLSSEEVIKAILVLLHSEGYDVYKIKYAKKFFSDHKIRHELAKLIEAVNGIIESGMEYEKNEKSNVKKFQNEEWNSFFNFIVDAKNAIQPFLKTGSRMKLLEKFNDNKNKGLYTDYRNELLIPSQVINEDLFNSCKETVERIIKTYKVLRIMYNPMISNHLKYENISKRKDELRNAINGIIVFVGEIKK